MKVVAIGEDKFFAYKSKQGLHLINLRMIETIRELSSTKTAIFAGIVEYTVDHPILEVIAVLDGRNEQGSIQIL